MIDMSYYLFYRILFVNYNVNVYLIFREIVNIVLFVNIFWYFIVFNLVVINVLCNYYYYMLKRFRLIIFNKFLR